MRAIGIILAGGNSHKMKELARKRAVGAMPVAGSYRAIDFALSNMSNSHIQKVAVFTQYNAKSLKAEEFISDEEIKETLAFSDVSREDYSYSLLP